MPTLGSFTLILNEAHWIAPHLTSWLPHLSEMVFYDGGSEDGTIEIIEAFRHAHPDGKKIRLFKDKNPKDLESDYTRLFDACLHELSTDLATFIHPDFYLEHPGNLHNLEGGISYTMNLRSFAGDPGGNLFEIVGRGEKWKNTYTLRPDLGLHYHGAYGSPHEDCYYREITGDEHIHHGHNFDRYPYPVVDSGAKVLHYSDVRTPRRRYERMVKCLVNQGHPLARAEMIAMQHPRVTLKDSQDFTFTPASYSPEFVAAREKYRHFEKELALV